MRGLTTILLIFFARFSICSQEVYYQNTIQGGVSVVGMSTADGYGFQSFNINIPDNSEILEAFFITHSTVGFDYEMLNYQCAVNGQIIDIVADSDFFYVVENNIVPFYIKGHKIYIKKISEAIGSISNNISIDWMLPSGTGNSSCPGCRVSSPYLVIVYENENLPVINLSIIVNQNPNQYSGIINLDGLNPVDLNFDAGLSIHCDRIGGNPNDGYEFFLDGTSVGVVNEPDISSLVGGVIGTFEYYNGTLFGLTDDVPNDTFSGSDAILRLNNYMTGSSLNGIQLTYNYLVPPNSPHNYFNTICLTYTSPCQPFGASLLTSDTTVCAGVPLQLGASGGTTSGSFQAYEWLPQQNLSCYDCPNPIFTGDSTINYTVRIRNTDSCSVVYPVRVRVLPKPNFESIEITESVCGGASGEILARPVSEVEPPHLFQLNGANTQLNEANYTNLAAGFYAITLTDGNACKRDSIVEIGEFNNVLADFSVNPSTGAAPLDIQISNQSQNASQYFWDFSDEDGNTISQTNGPFDSAQCPLAGVYTLTLIASNGFEHCADTASLTILVYDTLQVVVPNVFTPNSDGSNDWFGITATLDTELQIVLLNRWGNVMLEKQITLSANTFTPLWDGVNAPDGVYFYKIVLTSENKEMKGFVELRR